MTELFDTVTPYPEIALRFGAAAFAGGLIGFEREWRDRTAGLRTHMLVALAAAVFTVVAVELALQVAASAGDSARPDPLRVVEAVTAGVAFLGAGAIIKGGGDVQGLTTAAGLWLAGAAGLAAGAGFYGIVLLAAVIGVAIIVAVRALEAGVIGTKEPLSRKPKDTDGGDDRA